jgi:hypothetical protein
MTWFPKYKIYASDGLTLIYTFNAVTKDNSPQDPKKGYEVEGSRGQGSIHVPGSDASWDLSLRFHLHATDYQALIALMDSIQSTITMNTKYVLTIDRTPSSTVSYHVMRKQPISWEDERRTTYQFGTMTFRVNSW